MLTEEGRAFLFNRRKIAYIRAKKKNVQNNDLKLNMKNKTVKHGKSTYLDVYTALLREIHFHFQTILSNS